MFDLLPIHHSNSVATTSNAFDPFFEDDFFNLVDEVPFKMDVKEQDDRYEIEAEMPGIKKKNISLDFKDNVLTIEVNQKEDIKEKKHHFLHRERYMCSMCRELYLEDVNPESIEAKLEHGLLKIMVPKTHSTVQTHLIEVK